MKKIRFPVAETVDMQINDQIEIFGRIFCARDAALPRLVRLIDLGELAKYGIELRGAAIFHTAVSPAGIGPTSSNKLEIESAISLLAQAGVKMHLGKGSLQQETLNALYANDSVFAVTPPVSALFGSKIISQRVAAFDELGMEALYELEVAGLPAIIACANGKSILV